MEKTLQTLQELQNEGFYSRWAISGAMSLNMYIDPVFTEDLDVTIQLPPSSGLIVTLAPIFSELASRGFDKIDGDHVDIAGVSVQFLAFVPGSLEDDAMREARSLTLFGVQAFVFPLEHLLAIMIQLGRSKDKQRLASIIEDYSERVDWDCFHFLLNKHGLAEKFNRFKRTLDA